MIDISISLHLMVHFKMNSIFLVVTVSIIIIIPEVFDTINFIPANVFVFEFVTIIIFLFLFYSMNHLHFFIIHFFATLKKRNY